MPEPLLDPAIKPDVKVFELDAVEPPDELLAVVEPQPEEMLAPPPSNWALEAVFGHDITSGLSPGGFSSVAPSGIVPEEEEESEGDVPSGEVMPMPGGWLACALAAATLASNMIADKMHVPRIKFGLSCSRLVGNRQR